MSRLNLFIIHYKFFGKSKSCILRNAEMNNSDAWHWASCDLGGSASTARQATTHEVFQAFGREARHYQCGVARVSVGWTEVV